MVKTVVIGAGVMGLTAAFHALERGHTVTVVEGEAVAGGPAAQTDVNGRPVERLPYVIHKSDRALLRLLKSLGIAHKLRWRHVTLGRWADGVMHEQGGLPDRRKFWGWLGRKPFGYLEGGAQTLIDALVAAIDARGGSIVLAVPAQHIHTREGRVTGVTAGDRLFRASAVICTALAPQISGLASDLPRDFKDAYDAASCVGLVCVTHRLRRSVAAHLRVRIADPEMNLSGIIEASNLRPMDEAVVFAPYVLSSGDPRWRATDTEFIDESFGYLRRLNPALTLKDLSGSKVERWPYARPAISLGPAGRTGSARTPIEGLQIAAASLCDSEGFGAFDGLRLARAMAMAI